MIDTDCDGIHDGTTGRVYSFTAGTSGLAMTNWPSQFIVCLTEAFLTFSCASPEAVQHKCGSLPVCYCGTLSHCLKHKYTFKLSSQGYIKAAQQYFLK